jgi:hypothetical protein
MNIKILNLFKKLFLVSIVIQGCTKSPIGMDEIEPQSKKSNLLLSGKSVIYGGINSTTSSYYVNKVFPGFYYTLEKASEMKFNYNEFNHINADYRFNGDSKCFLDYDRDGLLDMFAFLTNFKDRPWGSKNGKYLLVSDVLGKNPKRIFYDANWRIGSSLKIIDIDKDGNYEIFFGNEEDHQLSDGSSGASSPFQILKISKDGSISTTLIGESVSTHGRSFGDIDNDGDLDIVVWRNPYSNQSNGEITGYPVAYINNGSGKYSQDNSFSRFKNLEKIITNSDGRRKNYPISSIELFDIDGDNILDLIASYTHNQSIPSWDYGHKSSRIYWGQSGGYFDFLNSYTDLPNEYVKNLAVSSSVNIGQLGFSFMDYDVDGDMDIFTVSTPGYGGYIIQLVENLGSRRFSDVTKSKFNVFYNIYERNSQTPGSFPAFYNLIPFDKDLDGDYDLVPENVGLWGIWQNKISQNLFWENRGGYFSIRN